ncbi:hypothetical protein SLNWT_6949 [Streptomyces albus]|uniref:Secreted protein n=1 Tax=Streptomyces albus (strain ATCC 21838 / DSM 41398 / FERM P-419 / JCM 4703 / NBRC 107858) TaxID=1081613 RepID=A0A0B5F700_STRA4|nr:hypothetical protein SLNWT_6949 [Streptomyces albus]AOU81628.1 hypothetical protein SLNHY_6937 [Streptomyces albus]AYN37319.1 hypothetical protein DUI70_6826 [Streptomyces albus]
MSSRNTRALLAGGAVFLVTAASWGAYAAVSDDSPPPANASPTAPETRAEGEEKAVIKLPDGRKVEVRYLSEKGLGERHYDPETEKWSATRLIYKTKSEACQGIELAASGGTVAAIADFGYFCSDGEPPEESVAAIGTGTLSTWAKDVQDGFDGWEKVKIAEGGENALFLQYTDERVTTLGWSKEKGFGETSEKPRPPKQLSKKFFGSWKSADGTQRVAVQKRGNHGVATFYSRQGPRCVTRVGLFTTSKNEAEFRGVFREEGERSTSCPAHDTWDFMKLNKAGTSLSFMISEHTFTKVEPNEEERQLPSPPPPVFSVDRDWLGDWQREDGSTAVTIAEPKADDPVATFTNQSGEHCVARVLLYSDSAESLRKVASKPVEVIEGKPVGDCPPKDVGFTLSAGGRTFTQKVEGEADQVYVRQDAVN